MSRSLSKSYFEQLYNRSDDPWLISEGWYEERKRALVMAVLPNERFTTAFEPGCGNGDLSLVLASRCDRLISWDVVEPAVERARQHCAGQSGLEFRVGALPDYWPEEAADLVVLSEVGYYLDEAGLERAVAGALARLVSGGSIVAVHWRHEAVDYPLSGDQVHEAIGAHAGLSRFAGYCDDDVRIDVFRTGRFSSLAREHGLLGA